MHRFKLGNFVQESLLASEELSQDTAKAEASTPQAFEQFIKTSEAEGLEGREEQAEEREEEEGGLGDMDGGGEGDPVGRDGDTPPDADGEPTGDDAPPADDGGDQELNMDDAVDDSSTEPQTESNEALDDWIREKTQGSDSGAVRNMGAAAAGLAKLGITYGPALLQSLWSGAIWTFSRIGTLIFSSSEFIGEIIERSKNSTDKLEKRLKNAESIIAQHINSGAQTAEFKYKNGKVINYLKTGNSLDIAGNLRQFAVSVTNANTSIVDEFVSGADSVNRLAQSASKDKVTSVSAFMDVEPPKRGFRKGSVPGYESKNQHVELYHTEPLWPGDASLVFAMPKSFTEMGDITKAYKGADMFVATGDRVQRATEQLTALSPTDLIMIAKSTKILLSACREVSKSQSKLVKYDEALSNAVKRTFFALADSQAKGDNKEAIAQMVYLRSHLVTKVYTKGSAAVTTHASRVASAAIQLLEDHAKRMFTES